MEEDSRLRAAPALRLPPGLARAPGGGAAGQAVAAVPSGTVGHVAPEEDLDLSAWAVSAPLPAISRTRAPPSVTTGTGGPGGGAATNGAGGARARGAGGSGSGTVAQVLLRRSFGRSRSGTAPLAPVAALAGALAQRQLGGGRDVAGRTLGAVLEGAGGRAGLGEPASGHSAEGFQLFIAIDMQ